MVCGQSRLASKKLNRWMEHYDTIFIMTSLPRTGTTSVSKMAEICGIKTIHVLECGFRDALDKGYRFFSNTPFYNPEFLCCMLELKISEVKFLYSHRDEEDWKKSMETLKKIWVPKEAKNKLTLLNRLCYDHMDSPKTHYERIKKISEIYKVEMLDYRLEEGWNPFCKFVGKEIPKCDMPILNKGTAKIFKEYQSNPE